MRVRAMLLAMLGAAFMLAGAPRAAPHPTLSTDKGDYAPGQVVTLTGTGFGAGEKVQLAMAVFDAATGRSVLPETTWSVTAADGSFVATYVVPTAAANRSLRCTAIGRTTGRTATVAFTDYLILHLGDTVWLDTNSNGVQDTGEPGVPGVTVKILDSAGQPTTDYFGISTTVTDANGHYGFLVAAGGDAGPSVYEVQFVLPAGYAFTTQYTGGDTALDSDANPATGVTGNYYFAAATPADIYTADAGLVTIAPPAASLGNFVWNDLNRNGIQDDGATGILGVTVTVTGGGQTFTATTDANGFYRVDNLEPGVEYSVSFSKPAGYTFTVQTAPGSTTANDSNPDANGYAGKVMLAPGEYNDTIDAGLYQFGSIGDYVWNDLNRNGIQDAGEQGIQGVTVTLYQVGSNTPFATATTDANGYYLFSNLPLGDYTVVFGTPAGQGWQFTTPGAGTDRSVDSNPDAGGNASVSLTSEKPNDLTIDAGLYVPSPPGIGIAKTADLLSVPAGGPATFTIKVTNTGGQTLNNVTVTDNDGTLPYVVTDGSEPLALAPGATHTYSVTAAPQYSVPSAAIASNFNGTKIPAGTTLWFNSVVTLKGLSGRPATLYFVNSKVTFAAGGVTYEVNAPDSKIEFSATATGATTVYNAASNVWETTVPAGYTGNVFLSGAAFVVPAGGLPGGINPVTWSGRFITGVSGITAQWKWAAAVYTQFGSYDAIGVKPVDGGSLSIYQNSDHAGTPENYKSYVIGGARGGGGSNFTGSYSGTGASILTASDIVNTATVTATAEDGTPVTASSEPAVVTVR